MSEEAPVYRVSFHRDVPSLKVSDIAVEERSPVSTPVLDAPEEQEALVDESAGVLTPLAATRAPGQKAETRRTL